MEPEINCSKFCDSFPGQELDRRPLHDLCRTRIATFQDSSSTISSLSPALLGIVWTFLSCGLLLMLFFLAFTIRCRKNRIVKMSSPNLNIVTLLGSCLTYSSAYLFGIQDDLVGSSMETLIQIRLSMLCIGTSLVFGPILGKSWRLYKVFTQRVPNKRVIIKDLQLLGLVAALVMADVVLLMTWVLIDPIQCLQILGVSMTVTGRDVSCSLTNTNFCASRYSDIWIALVLGCKGLLLLCGAYLAGLTDHVSAPPVNQSFTIMVGVNLLVLAAGLLFVVTRYLHSWPNLVFGLTTGGIFVCTTTVNCSIFIPQLKQWKAFEGENQTIRRMARYFSTPSKSFCPQFGEEQNCHARGEKSSLERLLTERESNALKFKILWGPTVSSPGTNRRSQLSINPESPDGSAGVPQNLLEAVRYWLPCVLATTRTFHILQHRKLACNFYSWHQRTEKKIAVIESLQEQVNNAKEKLVRLMSAECACDSLEWAVPPTSYQGEDVPAVASAHGLVPGPSECPSAPQKDPDTAAQDSRCTSGPSACMQSPQAPGRNTSPSPGLKKTPDLRDFSDHLDLTNSQKPQAEQSSQRGDQGPMAPSKSLVPGRGASDPQRQRQSSEEPPERLPRVSSVVREKLQEVIQELGLGPGAPLPNFLSCPQQPWKGSAAHSPQKMPVSKELGSSPYIVRRRRATQRARSHFPGSAPFYVGHRADQTLSGTHSGLNAQSGDSPGLGHQTADCKAQRPSPRKPLLLPEPQEKLGSSVGSKQDQAEPQGARAGSAAFLRQPSAAPWAQSPTAPCPATSPDLPEQQQQLQPPGPPGHPSLSSQCNYLDTESSSSDEPFCRCHRPYCEFCFQSSSDSHDSSTSDTDPEPAMRPTSWDKLCAGSKPIVNFKDDLKPTLV